MNWKNSFWYQNIKIIFELDFRKKINVEFENRNENSFLKLKWEKVFH